MRLFQLTFGHADRLEMRFLVSVLAALILVSNSSATAIGRTSDFKCESKNTISHAYIGQNQDVRVEVAQCSNLPVLTTEHLRSVLPRASNSTDVCNATCSTNCFTPSGGGPDPADCQVIADALLYSNQNTGTNFTIGPTGNKTNVLTLSYASCFSMMVNQVNETLTYCRNDWATLATFLSGNCQATQNAHGGSCVATDGRWFIQVNHS